MTLNTNELKVVVIVGPTASGKSDLGIKIAQKYNGEIISADSRQVYRGMDIGTGKVKKDRITNYELRIKGLSKENYYSEGILHYLIDVASPKKQFTASEFKKLGERAMKEIAAKGKIPVIVGGTGFYIDILLGQMEAAQVKPDKKLRSELEKQSAEQLFKRLQRLDPERAKTIDPHNPRRLIRAIEIFLITKKTSLNTKYKIPDTKYEILWLGIRPKDLEIRIKKRLDARLKQGMIEEVQRLHKEGVNWKRLDDFGLEYRWVSSWLKKQSVIRNSQFKNSDEYKNLLRGIIKYSKRQMTWFKRKKEIHWLTNKKATDKLVATFLS